MKQGRVGEGVALPTWGREEAKAQKHRSNCVGHRQTLNIIVHSAVVHEDKRKGSNTCSWSDGDVIVHVRENQQD